MVIHPYAKYIFVTVCLVSAGALFVIFFEQIPVEGTSLALDWKGIWTAILLLCWVLFSWRALNLTLEVNSQISISSN